jgi:hypothetical protein
MGQTIGDNMLNRCRIYTFTLMFAGLLGTLHFASPLIIRFCGQLVEKHQAGDVKGYLGKLREALATYGHDHAGAKPVLLDSLIPHYLDAIPSGILPYWQTPYNTARHPGAMRVKYFRCFAPDDTGGWGYINSPRDVNFGKVFVNCTHHDWTGNRWCDN